MVEVGKKTAARLLVLAPVALLATLLAPEVHVQLIRDAGGIPKDAEGLQGFIKTCNALVTPALVATAAATPLAVIGGGLAMTFGSRRGLPIVLTSLGMLALLGSVKGIVA